MRDITQTGHDTDKFPAAIVAEFDDADAAVAKRKALGDGFVVTSGINKLYAVRVLVEIAPVVPKCNHRFRSDLVDPYAVSCIKCGKFHRFAPARRSDFDDYRAQHDRDGEEY